MGSGSKTSGVPRLGITGPRLGRLPTLPKYYGGMAVPDVFKYYQAAHLCRVINWMAIEHQFSPVPFHRASWCYVALPASIKHQIIGPTHQVGVWFVRPPNSIHSPLFLILGNHSLPPSRQCVRFILQS